YARNGAVALLMLALLAAIGLWWLLGRSGHGRWVGFALLALVVVELAPVPPWRWHDVLPTTAHRWLAERPGPMRIMDCAEPSLGALSVTDLMPHPTAVLGIFSRRAIDPRRERRVWTDPEMWDPVRPLSDCAEPGLGPKLAALGYSHLVVRADYRLRDLVPRDGLVLLRRFDDADVFSVEAPKATVFMGEIEGLSWRSGTAERSFRWVGERGRFEVINGARSTVRAVLEIELFAFHRPRPTDVFLDGVELASAVVTPEPERFVWGPVDLPPGVSRLELVPRGDPLVPADILGTQDTRAITIGVGEWVWRVLDRVGAGSEPTR
ncbi:MAG: hypothetical protein R3244_05545, partial [Thermoanaerobaculia bacterium]|nr:hypothetical protein [Thermoanaerobaculia bacterium]